MISFRLLGQSGCRIEHGGTVIYMDPYLSNSVQELDAPDLKRLTPIPVHPAEVTDADWVLITHGHIDHCDPHTLPGLAAASRGCRFIGPAPVLNNLGEWGILSERSLLASEMWAPLSDGIAIRAVPAAHPEIERDEQGNLACVGYVLELNGKRIYLAGDTRVTEELLQALKACGPIHTAVLPVNERNFFRDRRGIVGNMSVREAFLLAEEVGVKVVIPVHWDMFEINSVDIDEIKAVYRKLNPSFDLQINPSALVI